MENKFTFIDRFMGNRVLTHIAFWLILFIFQSQVLLYSGSPFKVIALFAGVTLPSIVMAAYLLAYYQVPKLLLKGKYLKFGLSLLLSAYVFTVLARIMTVFIAEPILGIEDNISASEMLIRIITSPERLARNYLLSIYIAPCIMVFIKLIKQRSDEKRNLEQLEKEKTATELNFLKAQIHPHFLLNTLNNLYALTLKKSDKAPETVLKLSEMLTYVLYKCNEKFVPLEAEIQLIKNYISLERLRYTDDFKLEFKKDIQNLEQIQVAPLLLLSIVENAFKHGISGDTNNPEVRISISGNEKELQFEVFNTKNIHKQSDEQNYTKGIGSKNVRKQLDLIYGDNYSYEVEEASETYLVKLKIELKNIPYVN